MERRDLERSKRRLMVRFGVDGPEKMAFTKNLSETGVCIQTNAVIPPGKQITVELKFPDQTFTFRAHVVWAKRVPPQLAFTMPGGMGIRFIDPGPEWAEYYAQFKGSSSARTG